MNRSTRGAVGVVLLAAAGRDSRVPRDDPTYPRDVLKHLEPPLRPASGRLPDERTRARPAAAAFGGDDGQWLMPLEDYAGTRYSGLDQINTATVWEGWRSAASSRCILGQWLPNLMLSPCDGIS